MLSERSDVSSVLAGSIDRRTQPGKEKCQSRSSFSLSWNAKHTSQFVSVKITIELDEFASKQFCAEWLFHLAKLDVDRKNGFCFTLRIVPSSAYS